MAINFTSRTIKSVTFHGTLLKGVQNADLSDDAGSVVPLNGDSQLNIEDVFVDNRQMNLAITLSDPNQTLGVFAVGDNGAVEVVFTERKHSDSTATGPDRKVTIPATVCTNVPSGLPHEGLSNTVLQAQAAAPGGAALYSIADVA